MLSKFLFLSLILSTTICHAVNIGCPEVNKKEIQKFDEQVEKARFCKIDSGCTTHKFHKLGNACQTFDSAVNKTKLKSLIKKYKTLPYCYHGIAQCLIYMLETDKTICKNQLCTVTYKKLQPSHSY